MTEKIVVAVGGSALQAETTAPTVQAQLETVRRTAERLAVLTARGNEIAIVHGSGPQLGRIVLSGETAADVTPAMPLDVCTAMSQGYIGYHLQQGLRAALDEWGIARPVVTFVTQVVVDAQDPAFRDPAKPIGPYCTPREAEQYARERGYTMKEDAGRGYRRVLACPLPRKIVEIEAIQSLWPEAVIVACGGGGIPVIRRPDGSLEGVAAVIDKDYAAELLAEQLHADTLLILTAVDRVALRYGEPEQENLSHLTAEQAERYCREGHFAAGSMLPKVRAALKFVQYNPTGRAIIAALERAGDALDGKTGTVVTLH